MKDLWAILKYEALQLLTKKIVTVLVLILTAGLAFVLLHTHEYKNLHDQKIIFQDVEKNKIEMYSSYRQYASFGFRILFHPAPISILFANSAVIQDMTAYIDSGERLNIYKPMKSKNVFNITKYMFADCSGIFLFFASLIAVFYGFPAFRESEYLKMLSSIAGKKNLFCKVLLGRSILLAVYSLLFLGSAVSAIALCGISIGIDQYLVVFFLEMCGLTAFFLVLGSAFGSIKSMRWGLGGVITSWLLLLFFLPFLISLIVSISAASLKPETKLEIEKLTLMMNFEKRFNDETGSLPLNKTPTERQSELVLDYYKNEFQAMQKLEDQLKAQMHACIRLHYRLSSFFPTTFYQSLTNELSSKGYETLESFYNTVKQIKEDFFKEYIQKVYFSPQPTRAEPFLKGDENIVEGKPAVPSYLAIGYFFNLLWMIVLAIPTYYRFKKNLCNLPEKEKDAPQPKEIILKRGKANNNWYVCDDLLKNQLLTLLFNEAHEFKKKGYTFKVFLDDQDLLTAKKQQNFLYLCHPKAIPGHFVMGHFLTLVMDLMRTATEKRKEIISQFSLEPAWKKKFCQLDIEELGNVFLAILELKTFDVYLIDDIGKGMLLDFCIALQEKISILRDAEDAAVLFLWTDLSYVKKEKEKRLTFYECKDWLNTIESLKQSPTAAGAKYPKE
jgi:hypothetical protein